MQVPPAVDPPADILVQAVQDLSRARHVDDVVAVVRSAARKVAGADGCAFVLRDEGNCHYVDEDAIGPLWKGQRFPMSACVSGWAMTHGKSAAIPDIYEDPRVPHDAYRPTFVKSLLMVPIRANDPLGAIGTYWATNHAPTEHEVRMLEALANTTAVALENVHVYQELEQRVRQRTSELLSVNAELEAFNHTLSHDLRSPLRTIHAYSQILERMLERPSPEIQKVLLQLQASALRASQLFEVLLEFSSLSKRPLAKETVSMRQVAAETIAEVRREFHHEVSVHVADDLPACEADATLIRQVLHNLVANGLKFTRQAGARLEIGGARSATETTYFVKDNGVGFEASQAGELFSPFQSLHDRKEFPGTGIGLSIVKRIVERHGGRVWAEASPGRGATFYFTVPRPTPDGSATPRPA